MTPLIAVVAACSGGAAERPVAPPQPPAEVAVAPAPDGRLGDGARPVAYRLELEVDPEVAVFRGAVEIDVELTAPASSIWLHGEGLTVRQAVLRRGGDELALAALAAPEGRGLLGFAFGRTLAAGPATIRIEYDGLLGEIVGLFRQRWKQRWYVFTDFEPVDARRAFPCFDDPRFKAPWTVTLTVPHGNRAFANAPVERVEKTADGRVRHRFATTPLLPSYLVAVAVGPFEVFEGARQPIPIRVIGFAGDAGKVKHSLTAAAELLPLAIDWVGMPVPFRKLDLIAVPNFDGAMENPGLVTVHYPILMIDDDDPPPGELRFNGLVIAHEIAHLWFGDLVSPAWWDDLWLNEGFASYLADELLERWRPSWRWDLGRAALRVGAFERDARADIRAVREPIDRESAIRDAFSTITYVKGGAVLEMLERWLGDASFRRGVRRYLAAHAWKNATTDDLIAALAAETDRPVGEVLRAFVEEPGAPMVSARWRCDGGATVVDLAQRRLRALGEQSPDRLWPIPICPEGGSCTLLRKARGSLRLPGCRADVVVNDDGAGYFLVDSSLAGATGRSQRELLMAVESVRSRFRAGELAPSTRPLAPLAAARLHGPAALRLAETADALSLPTRSGASRAAALLPTVAAVESSDRLDDRQVRPELVARRGFYGNPPSIDGWLAGREAIAPELLEATLVAGVQAKAAAARARLHAGLLARLTTERDPTARAAIVAGLASVPDAALLDRSLALTLSASLGRIEAMRLLYRALENLHTRARAFAFIGANLRQLAIMRRLSPFMGQYACSDAELAIAEQMWDGVDPDDDKRRRALDYLRAEARLCTRLANHYR